MKRPPKRERRSPRGGSFDSERSTAMGVERKQPRTNHQHKVESLQAEDQTQSLYSTISKTEEIVESSSTQESEEKATRKFFTYIP